MFCGLWSLLNVQIRKIRQGIMLTMKPYRRSIMAVAQASQFRNGLLTLYKSRSSAIGARWLFLLMTLLLPTLALGSTRSAGDYIRADFTVEEGLPDNVVSAIVQTANGLLWVGT
jgi:hypothetical protein